MSKKSKGDSKGAAVIGLGTLMALAMAPVVAQGAVTFKLPPPPPPPPPRPVYHPAPPPKPVVHAAPPAPVVNRPVYRPAPPAPAPQQFRPAGGGGGGVQTPTYHPAPPAVFHPAGGGGGAPAPVAPARTFHSSGGAQPQTFHPAGGGVQQPSTPAAPPRRFGGGATTVHAPTPGVTTNVNAGGHASGGQIAAPRRFGGATPTVHSGPVSAPQGARPGALPPRRFGQGGGTTGGANTGVGGGKAPIQSTTLAPPRRFGGGGAAPGAPHGPEHRRFGEGTTTPGGGHGGGRHAGGPQRTDLSPTGMPSAGGPPIRNAVGPAYDYRGRPFSPVQAPAYDYGGGSYDRYDVGSNLPLGLRIAEYVLQDYIDYELQAPGDNQEWVRYGDDMLLVDTDSGQVVDAVYGFYAAPDGDQPDQGYVDDSQNQDQGQTQDQGNQDQAQDNGQPQNQDGAPQDPGQQEQPQDQQSQDQAPQDQQPQDQAAPADAPAQPADPQ